MFEVLQSEPTLNRNSEWISRTIIFLRILRKLYFNSSDAMNFGRVEISNWFLRSTLSKSFLREAKSCCDCSFYIFLSNWRRCSASWVFLETLSALVADGDIWWLWILNLRSKQGDSPLANIFRETTDLFLRFNNEVWLFALEFLDCYVNLSCK